MASSWSKGNNDINDAYPKRAAGPIGKPIPHIQRSRLLNFASIGQYESQNLLWQASLPLQKQVTYTYAVCSMKLGSLAEIM